MADLEEEGYITHPYTSAGRIPTDKGYRFYIDSLMRVRKLNEHIVRAIAQQYSHALRSLEDVLEKTSRLVSEITNYVGITFFPQNERVYLEGTSHMIEQPEFKDLKRLHNFLRCLEEKNAILDILSGDIEDCKLTVRIGQETHLNDLSECSIVARGYKVKGKRSGGVGVIGPKRMAYEKVIPAVELLADKVTNILEEMDEE
jgi:heat-inducible transcriptional repressor